MQYLQHILRNIWCITQLIKWCVIVIITKLVCSIMQIFYHISPKIFSPNIYPKNVASIAKTNNFLLNLIKSSFLFVSFRVRFYSLISHAGVTCYTGFNHLLGFMAVSCLVSHPFQLRFKVKWCCIHNT